MTPAAFNAFCRTLPATTYVCQWGGSHVWKIGGKVFAIGSWDEPLAGITFNHAAPGLSDRDLKQYLRLSHELVAQGLTKKSRAALGLTALKPSA